MSTSQSLGFFYITELVENYTLDVLSNSGLTETIPTHPKSIEKSYIICFEELDNDNHQECPICKEDFHSNMLIAKLDCGHIFCKDCIQYWVENKKSCPYCRTQVVYKSERFSDPFIELTTMF